MLVLLLQQYFIFRFAKQSVITSGPVICSCSKPLLVYSFDALRKPLSFILTTD